MMDKILFCVQGVRISFDDVIIYGKTMAQLAQRARTFFLIDVASTTSSLIVASVSLGSGKFEF